MITNDIVSIISWWFLFLVVGIISLPLCWLFFKRFVDLGYGLAKTTGFLIITFAAFFLGTLHLAPLTNLTLYSILAIYLAINVLIFWKNKQKIYLSILKNLRTLIAQEILFTAGFVFWTLIRGYQPDIRGLEKFMDFGFINSILKSQYLPPIDMWFAQKPINYYWFGHLWVAVATKLSNIPSAVTYNLMLATILGLTLVSAFSIVSTLVKKLDNKIDKRVFFAAGIISALLLAFAGNFHTPIYALKEGPKNYWYPDATRFIGYNPETEDKTIHEFPIYSFVVSDLHAHLINLPFVLLFIAFLLNYTARLKDKDKSCLKNILPVGFVLGVMFMTNTWDFGNYFLLSVIAISLINFKNNGANLKSIFKTSVSLLAIVAIGLLAALPFIFNFESITQGIRFVNNRTPLWQLGVLWGFPAVLTAIFIFFLYKLRHKTRDSDLFILSLLFTSWLLIAIPEVVYVKDIYIASHHRANTMFKLTYQAFVMFYLSSGYIAIRTLSWLKNTAHKSLLLIFYTLLFASVLAYPSFAINSFYGELKNYRGLSGDFWLKDSRPSEYAVISWLKNNTKGQPIILEAPGDSYTDFNVISSYTGLPTVSGWFVHEWLWRGDSSFPQERVNDIIEIYTSSDISRTKNLLNKYGAEYVIIGTFEHQKYPNLNEEKFSQLGKKVFSQGKTRVYQIK